MLDCTGICDLGGQHCSFHSVFPYFSYLYLHPFGAVGSGFDGRYASLWVSFGMGDLHFQLDFRRYYPAFKIKGVKHLRFELFNVDGIFYFPVNISQAIVLVSQSFQQVSQLTSVDAPGEESLLPCRSHLPVSPGRSAAFRIGPP